MTMQEFNRIRVIIKSNWPAHSVVDDDVSINIWYQMLKDLTYKTCEMALMELSAQLDFPPSIAQIRKKYAEYTSPPVKEAGEAWEDVRRLIRKYGWPGELEALAEMDELTRRAAKSIGFLEICRSEAPDVVRGQFLRIYETLANRQKADAGIPKALAEFKHRQQERIANGEKEGQGALAGDGEGISGPLPDALPEPAVMGGLVGYGEDVRDHNVELPGKCGNPGQGEAVGPLEAARRRISSRHQQVHEGGAGGIPAAAVMHHDGT